MINVFLTSLWSKIVYPYKPFVLVDGLKVTELVLLVKYSLPP